MGCHLAKMLAGENHNLTIIDSDPDRLTAISDEADVVTILGNPTSIDTLERAGENIWSQGVWTRPCV